MTKHSNSNKIRMIQQICENSQKNILNLKRLKNLKRKTNFVQVQAALWILEGLMNFLMKIFVFEFSTNLIKSSLILSKKCTVKNENKFVIINH